MSEVVLEALGDLTNGALNYYQTTHVVMAKRKIIETYIKQLQQENQQLKDKINTYEDPEDLTLMFMYCEEKEKDKIKQLENNWNELKKWLKDYRKNKDILVPVSIVELKMQELENNND